jgi:LPXTG-motif cell wall-anchored protein
VVDPGDQVMDLGPVSPSEREQQESELDPVTGLPTTGHNDRGAAAVGFAIFAAGVGLTALGSWRRRTHGDRGR